MSATSWDEVDKLDFVTLAKAGGRKSESKTCTQITKVAYLCNGHSFCADLLYHHENKRLDEAQPYPPSVEWFSHPSPVPKGPVSPYRSSLAGSWMVWNTGQRLPELHIPSTEALVQKKEPNLDTRLPPLYVLVAADHLV